MESKEEELINDIFDIIKELKENKDFFEEKKLDCDIFNKIANKESNNRKKYLTFNYTQIYIVNRKPIQDIMNRLNFDEFEEIMNKGNDEEENEKNIKNKIKNFINDIKLDNYTKDLKFYSNEKESIEIIENNIDIFFIKENLLKVILMNPKIYKKKEVFFGLKQGFIFFYFPYEHSTLMLNLALISDKKSICNSDKDKSDLQNTNSPSRIKDLSQKNGNDKEDKKAEETKETEVEEEEEKDREEEDKKEEKEKKIKEEDKENKENKSEEKVIDNQINENKKDNISDNKINNEINSNEIEAKNRLNKNLDLITNHLNYLNLIYQLQSIDINDISNINQIESIILNNNNLVINCYLINSAIFDKIKENIYYEDCENIFYSENEDEKRQKTCDLYEKIKKDNKEIDNKIEIINNYEECFKIINNKIDAQFMFVDEKFCEEINIDKKYYNKSNMFLFSTQDGYFLFFKDKRTIMKVFCMNKYFKININTNNLIEVPKSIVDDLVLLYEESKRINDSIDEEIKENNFDNYYIINKNWLNQYKNYYNYNEIILKYEVKESAIEYEEDSKQNNINNKNNYNDQNQNQNYKKGKKKNKKRKKKRKNNNYNSIHYQNKIIETNNKIEKVSEIKVQYMNVEYPKFLLDQKNILPIYYNFKNFPYPVEFELIKIETFKKLCSHLNINITSIILDKINFKALLGDSKIYLQRESKDNSLAVFSSIGFNNILEYFIIYDNKDLINKEIDIIKNKGIDKYLADMGLKFDDDSLQYLVDQDCTSTIGKIYVANKKQLYEVNTNTNISLNIINDYIGNKISLNNNISNNTCQYSFTHIEQISPFRLGLDNIGATCYMNATLQCLCNIVQLQNYFLNNNQIFQNSHANLSKAFCNVLQNLYNFKKNKKSFAPNNFKNIIGDMNNLFKGIAANDSKDLILFIYEKIHEELNSPNNYNNVEQNISLELQLFRQNYYSNNSSIIEKTFYFEQETINQCNKCKNKIINYNIQNIIIFPLEKIRLNLLKVYPNGFPCVYLDECFAQISLSELMDGVNSIYCNNCGKNSSALYTTKMHTCPEIITINLNRGKGIEFDVVFDYPLRIDISNYVNSKNKCTIYDLIGVVIHTGGSDMSGHFFAFCKSNIDHNWYKYNDSIVEKCSENYEYEFKNIGLPYVLFYQNVDCINNMNNQIMSLYFRTSNGYEIYFDVNGGELFFNVIQRLSQKYSNCNCNFLNAKYYIKTMQGDQFIDFNKSVKENNLWNYSFIIIEL